jgi:hypothetical protein
LQEKHSSEDSPKFRDVWVKEDEEIECEQLRKLLVEPGFRVLPRRWVVEWTFSWIETRTEG